jgi:hypothetical protein
MPMNGFKSIHAAPKYVAGITLISVAIWCVSAVVVVQTDPGKGLSYLAGFWVMAYFLGPIVCACCAGLLAYDYFRRKEPLSTPIRRAMLIGFVPVVSFIPLLLLRILWDDLH